ncbi:MAG: hypothetical protein ACYC9R_06185 [Nitrosotalea sp.]
MNKIMIALAVSIVLLVGCSKQPADQGYTAPAVMPSVTPAVSVTPVPVQSEVAAPVEPAPAVTPAPVAKPKVVYDAEAAAYRKAYANAALANKLLGEHRYRVSRTDKV